MTRIKIKIQSSVRMRSRGNVTMNAPITAAMAPLAPSEGIVELGSPITCAIIATIPPAR